MRNRLLTEEKLNNFFAEKFSSQRDKKHQLQFNFPGTKCGSRPANSNHSAGKSSSEFGIQTKMLNSEVKVSVSKSGSPLKSQAPQPIEQHKAQNSCQELATGAPQIDPNHSLAGTEGYGEESRKTSSIIFESSNFRTKRPLVLSHQLNSGSNEQAAGGLGMRGGGLRDVYQKYESLSLSKMQSRSDHQMKSQILGKRSSEVLQNRGEVLNFAKRRFGAGDPQRRPILSKVRVPKFKKIRCDGKKRDVDVPMGTIQSRENKLENRHLHLNKLLIIPKFYSTISVNKKRPNQKESSSLPNRQKFGRMDGKKTQWFFKEPKKLGMHFPYQSIQCGRPSAKNNANDNTFSHTFFELNESGKIQLSKKYSEQMLI